jgi:3-methylcrotonyl-CoA carboxylase alpha subunit
MFRKVLIANRGEIAVRVQRTLREMGIPSVAVYSDVDRHAPHVITADEAYEVGSAEATASYLNQDSIIAVARQAGCDAVHPGYGFLSENATFARRCTEAGLTFLGPPPEAIEAMGSKLRSRELMLQAGVPVVPGSQGTAQDVDALQRDADRMGYPVLLKASAGGGGKGMRIVDAPQGLARAIEVARSEAEKAFGDGTLYLEKYISRSRHIEIQVFADDHDNVVHLFERECSIQRRHQKIIEEAPSVAVDEGTRRRMGEAAVAAARAVGYRGAGTVEFLMDDKGEFYFLEMNTRLQVEHPVTECITSLDLVRLQVDVAAGHALPPQALHPVLSGHAIECRIYAEDPQAGFLPASGRLHRVRLPEGPGIRVDGALRDAMDVSIHYDPLLAKLVTFGVDRPRCIERMQSALAQFVVLGITTNIPYLQTILAHPAFQKGDLSTSFVEDHLTGWEPPQVALPEHALAAVRLHELVGEKTMRSAAVGGMQHLQTPWDVLAGWRQHQDGSV